MKKYCPKCGDELPANADYRGYCRECLVRLGFVPHSAGVNVDFGPAYYRRKQEEEPILSTWCMGRDEDFYDDNTQRGRDDRAQKYRDWFIKLDGNYRHIRKAAA